MSPVVPISPADLDGLPLAVVTALGDLASLEPLVAPVRSALRAAVGQFTPDEAIEVLDPYVADLLGDVCQIAAVAAHAALEKLHRPSRERTVTLLIGMAAYCTVVQDRAQRAASTI
jgi:hypothetical protein